MSIINWAKTHKIILALVLIIIYLLRGSYPSPIGLRSNTMYDMANQTYTTTAGAPMEKAMAPGIAVEPQTYRQINDSSGRVVIQESNLSLLVKNVRSTGDKIIDTAKTMGGYMVSVSYNNPSEQAYATISVRVPTNRLSDALNQFRGSAIKVTNENLMGTDVTQDYQDLDQRLTTLKTTKTKFEEILKKATTVQEILEVNREIISLEQQIDSTTGQKMALADNARLTKITLFLSTDELALPYTPDKVFRPDVVFKLAIRSLLSTVQSFAEFLIWAGVYSLIWIPLIAIVILIKRWRQKARTTKTT